MYYAFRSITLCASGIYLSRSDIECNANKHQTEICSDNNNYINAEQIIQSLLLPVSANNASLSCNNLRILVLLQEAYTDELIALLGDDV